MLRYVAFISYAHHYQGWVEVLQRNLERCLAACGETRPVFIDTVDLGSGRSWVGRMQEGLDQADHLVLVVTPEAMASSRVAQEYETFIGLRRDYHSGRLHVVQLIDTPLPPFIDLQQRIDLRDHDDAAYRKALARLVAGLLRRDPRDLPELPDNLEIPDAPAPLLPAAIRQRLIDWLVPTMQVKMGRRSTATILGLDRHGLDGYVTAAEAASAAIVTATRDPDVVAGVLRFARAMAGELEEDETARRDELQALCRDIEALGKKRKPSGPGLLGAWLDRVVHDHERLVPYFQERTGLDLLDRVYVQLELQRRRYDLERDEARLRLDRPWTIRDLLELDPAEHPWVTRRWAVRGDPGAGKTTLLRHLAASVARTRPARWVPVFASLPRLMREPEWLLDRLEREMRRSGAAAEGLSAALEREGHEGRLLLLLDGLDEVPREHRDEAESLLRQLAERWPAAPLVVTSRPIGYRRPDGSFQELDLLPFDGEQRREFLARWFVRDDGEPDQDRAEQAAAELEAEPGLRELAGNPLYLTLMALLIRKGAAPRRRRTGLYDQVFQLLLAGEHRQPPQPIEHPVLVRQVLQHLACGMTRDNRDAEPVEELQARLYLPELDGLRAQLERVVRWERSMRPFLDDVAERTGILGPHDGPTADWCFWHRTFREALTAEHLEQTLQRDGEAALLVRAQEIAAGDESRWAEPYALLSGRVDDPDALVLTLAETNRALGLRAVATAQGLQDDTFRQLLNLTDDWKERREVFAQIPELIGEPQRALELVNQLRRRTRNGNDLYFLDLTITAVTERWPDAQPGAEQLRQRFFDHIPAPSADLFEWIDTPHDGKVPLWRKIPDGSFLMGSPDDEEEGFSDERPRHRVTITSPFLCSATPVTNAQYHAFDPGHEPSQWDGITPEALHHHPVETVTWYEAVSFCRWLSSVIPALQGARLPAEEEWEYACRAGTATQYWSGDTEADLADVGWYSKNSNSRTHRVGEKRANPWDLYDMHGNVWEWALTAKTSNFKGREAGVVVDPLQGSIADLAGASGDWRVVRGGGCWSAAVGARAAYRGSRDPGSEDDDQGFRVVVPVSPEHRP